MRFAVFSDLHGNPYACEAVLQAIKSESSCDAIVAAGDLCLGGSDPAACVELLRDAGVIGVYGNTEEYLYAPEQVPNDEPHRKKWHRIQPVAYWVLSQLKPDHMDWLSALPFEQRFSPTGSPGDDLLVVHANPKDVELMIYPPMDEQVKLWGHIRQPDDDPDLIYVLEDEVARMVAFGHFHYVFTRRWQDMKLVNVASCSLPGIDHDWRARYTLFTWEGGRWQITRRWVKYNVSQELEALRNSDMPCIEDYINYFE